MLFERPRETRRITHVMTRTGIACDVFGKEEVSVMVRWPGREQESPSWMEIGEAFVNPSLVVVTHDDPRDFNADLARIVMEYGPKGISGSLKTQDIEVVDRPARSATVGAMDAVVDTLRAYSRIMAEEDDYS